MTKWFATLFAILSITSCYKEDESLARMCEIKEVGNNDPQLAMKMLDSMKVEIESESKYVGRKCELLQIRLSDKADVLATSDLLIKKLVPYFDKEGTERDRQEVHYYAGSVYRDLKDTPRALEHFLQSEDIALGMKGCDSLMLRNTYSNLHWLYFCVQDYENALKTAKKEYEVAEKLNVLDAVTINHLGISLYKLGKEKESAKYFKETLRVLKTNPASATQETLSALLFYFSELQLDNEADRCFEMIGQLCYSDGSSKQCAAKGHYYWMKANLDSAIHYFKKVFEQSNSLEEQADVSKWLCQLYKQRGNNSLAFDFAQEHILVNSQLDYGKRQILAATTNNLYQYHRDKRAEEKMREERENLTFWLTTVVPSVVLIVVVLASFTFYRRYRLMKKILSKSRQLKDLNTELSNARTKIKENNQKLANLREKMEKAERYIERIGKQNPTIERLMSRINAVEYDSDDNLTEEEWKELYKIISNVSPDYFSHLINGRKTIGDKKMKTYCLMCLKLTDSKIGRIIGESRCNVGRWRKSMNREIPDILSDYGESNA